MEKRAAIYVRVSTDKQTIENQLRELRQIAQRRGWQMVEEYHDAGISGAMSGVQLLEPRFGRQRPASTSVACFKRCMPVTKRDAMRIEGKLSMGAIPVGFSFRHLPIFFPVQSRNERRKCRNEG